jgi:hypothetical protein
MAEAGPMISESSMTSHVDAAVVISASTIQPHDAWIRLLRMTTPGLTMCRQVVTSLPVISAPAAGVADPV